MESGFAASEADAFALIAGDTSVIGGGDWNAGGKPPPSSPACAPHPIRARPPQHRRSVTRRNRQTILASWLAGRA